MIFYGKKVAKSVYFTFTTIFLSLVFFSLPIHAAVTPDDGRIVYIKAKDLVKVRDFSVDRLSLFAVRNGVIVPIASQIDEMTNEGYVYFKEGKYKNSGRDGIFDAEDLLMFMLKDAGEKLTNQKVIDGKLLAEIEATFMSGKKGYVYLVQDALLSSDELYVRYSADTGRVESEYYYLKSRPDNAFVWEELYVESYDGKNKHYPFDTMKLRFGSSVAFVGPRLNFSNNNIVAKPVDNKIGSIRSIAQYKLEVKIAGIPFLSFDLQTHMGEQSIRYIALMKIPRVRRTLISKPAVFISLDGRELDGAQTFFAGYLDKPSVTDGKISEQEMALMEGEMSEENNWIMMNTGNHLSGLAILNFSDFEKIPVSPFIQDDPEEENSPEFFKGQSPNVGFQLKGMSFKGVQVIDVTLHLLSDEVQGDLNKFVKQYKAPTHVAIKYY